MKKTDNLWLVLAIIVGGMAILLIGSPWNPLILGMGMGMMGFGWGSMFLIPLAFLVLIVFGAYYLVTELTRTNRSASSQNRRPSEILKERYAKGELTRERYLEMKEEPA
jgi:putative membrane protein